MQAAPSALWLRIYVHESVRCGRRPLYEALVILARREGLAGATVYRAMEGFGAHRHLHTTRLVDVSDDLPMIVEFVDSETAIRRFLGLLDALVPHGTATLSPVQIVIQRPESTP
jgi:PII-like signaling protein